MKRHEFIGKLVHYKSLPSSCYGNPAYYGCFENENGDCISGRTASNASCAYGFLNDKNRERKLIYHYTKKGEFNY